MKIWQPTVFNRCGRLVVIAIAFAISIGADGCSRCDAGQPEELREAASALERGKALCAKKDFKAAVVELSHAISLDPKMGEAYYLRGVANKAMKQYQPALADLDRAIELKDDFFPEAVEIRGHILFELKRYDEAVKDFRDLTRYGPVSMRVQAYRDLGDTYYKMKEWGSAILTYEDWMTLSPDDPYAYSSRGLAFVHGGAYYPAIDDFTRAIALSANTPMESMGYVARGNAWQALEEYDRAMKDYDKALVLNPKESRAMEERGHIFRERKQYERAITEYDRAITLDPDRDKPYVGRGYAHLQLGHIDVAIENFNKAINLNKSLGAGYGYRGVAYGKKKQYAEAIRDLNTAVQLDPDVPDYYQERAIIYKAMGDGAKADSDNNRYKELSSKAAEWKRNFEEQKKAAEKKRAGRLPATN